jgi:hypothetical protein
MENRFSVKTAYDGTIMQVINHQLSGGQMLVRSRTYESSQGKVARTEATTYSIITRSTEVGPIFITLLETPFRSGCSCTISTAGTQAFALRGLTSDPVLNFYRSVSDRAHKR